jgi:hypothetical protein
MPRILLNSLVVASVVVAGCGDNQLDSDGSLHHDAGNLDAPSFPAPPTLGAQIDRVGRPAIAATLIGVFDADQTRAAAVKDAYAHAADPATWRTTTLRTGVTIETEIKANLAVFDVVDLGVSMVPMNGCRNALRYIGPPSGMSYKEAADLFADDQLYVDTDRATCEVYFALEIEFADDTSPHMTCGGRMPSHDVIDVTYSVLAAGTKSGLDPLSNPPSGGKLHDNASVHGDLTETAFPFLGPPH